ncbi:DNA repair protein RadC [Neokomagataea thailandica NBRC 106555]|nr:JAB domain-containing protein [Neokomagataea thailandica]GBR55304.1 DNA repair protein RadC [Neokomagataea thailandica NBRC 106555]
MSAGAETLADYELLEMLLFLGIARRDTKPLAKGLLSEFGSLINVFRAPTVALRQFGLNDATIRALRMPAIGAERLAAAEHKKHVTLGDWSQLTTYLEKGLEGAKPQQCRILFLDNRNRLLADEASPDENNPDAQRRGILRRALTLNATALIGLFVYPTGKEDNLSTIARALTSTAHSLAIAVHDFLIIQPGSTPRSMRQEGRL